MNKTEWKDSCVGSTLFVLRVSEIPESFGVKFAYWFCVDIDFPKAILENKFVKLIPENFDVIDLIRLLSWIPFSSVFCSRLFVFPVSLLNTFLRLFFKDFLKAFARGLDLLMLQHNFCVYNAIETIDVCLNISELFFKNIINNVTSDFLARTRWVWLKLIWRHLAILQTHHVYSIVKGRGNDRFHVFSTGNTCGVFTGEEAP